MVEIVVDACETCGGIHFYDPKEVNELWHASREFLDRFEARWAGDVGAVTLPTKTALAWGRLKQALDAIECSGGTTTPEDA